MIRPADLIHAPTRERFGGTRSLRSAREPGVCRLRVIGQYCGQRDDYEVGRSHLVALCPLAYIQSHPAARLAVLA